MNSIIHQYRRHLGFGVFIDILSMIRSHLYYRFITREEFVGEQEKLSLQDRANIAFNLIDRSILKS